MKVQKAKSKYTCKGHICRHCNKAVKVGQYFIEQRMPNNPINDRYFTLHVTCLRDMIADTPPDEDTAKTNFDRIRSKGYETLYNEILTN